MFRKICLFLYLLSFSFWVDAQEVKFQNTIDSLQIVLSSLESTDSLKIAREHYFIGRTYRKALISDSAYFYCQKAEKVFRNSNLKLETARTLYEIAVTQANDKDYTGSEVTCFEAIVLLEEIPQTNEVKKYKAYTYNCLGIVFDELDLYEDAIKYFEKSLSIKNTLEGDFERSIGLSLNNMLKVYRRSGEYELAFKKYKEIVDNKTLVNRYPDVHVLALGNYANTLFLSDERDQLPGLYLKALKICDSTNDSYNSIIINQHLAEFYNSKKDLDSAKHYAYKAKSLSEKYSNDDLLKSLLLLSKIERGEKAAEFLEAYIKLNDSVQKAERKTRNKFARIRFETQQIEQENEQIARERMWLIIISIILLISALLIYIIISQRAKNKELKFAKQQQEANEEIYNLMLNENEKIEEARTIEKQRISQELHDGVLGRLFGTRLSLDSLNMNNSDQAVKTRSQYISELKTIEDDIRKVSHELNTDFISGSGFIDMTKTMVETQTTAYKLNYSFKDDDIIHWDAVSNKDKIHIYRMLQETLHNIHKHAQASHVNISIRLKNDVICLTIEDNGQGFDVAKARSGIGIKNMNARIAEVEGIFEIESEKNKGTIVRIEVPTKYL